jgi:hypothetical protein
MTVVPFNAGKSKGQGEQFGVNESEEKQGARKLVTEKLVIAVVCYLRHGARSSDCLYKETEPQQLHVQGKRNKHNMWVYTAVHSFFDVIGLAVGFRRY